MYGGYSIHGDTVFTLTPVVCVPLTYMTGTLRQCETRNLQLGSIACVAQAP